MWGALIGIFIGIWVLQILLTWVQVKHYQSTVRSMSQRGSGFLGTGVEKRKLGIGNVVIIVCDPNGVVVDSQVMSGVTVFARFQRFEQIIGNSIDQLLENDTLKDLQKPITDAVKNIRGQMKAKT